MRRKIAFAALFVSLATCPALMVHSTRADARASAADGRTGDVIVQFRHGTSLADVGAALAASLTDPVRTTTLPDIALVRPLAGETVDEAIASLRAGPDVVYAEPDYLVTADIVPNDTNYASQWNYPKIGMPAAWDTTTGSASVIVAVVDTGVELTDPELDSKITSGVNAGYDFVNSDNDPTDDNGHGTHVAGTIAAESNNGAGVAGVCWACKIMPVKVLDSTGNGSTLTVAAGIDWARTHGAKVVNLSLGALSSDITLQNAVNNAWAAGVVVVAAAGNNAGDADTSDDHVLFPAAYPNAIGVGATDSTDTVASFSNYGPELDVTAPGVGIWSTVLGSGYGSWSGTSMAAPHVAGAVGLIMSAGITDPTTIRSRLTSTATDRGPAGFDDHYGYGRINVQLAVDTTVAPPGIAAPSDLATVSGSAVTFSATAADSSGIAMVRFSVDGATLVDDATAPYSTTWNTTGYANGGHTLQVQAWDNAGNSASRSITVTVNNGDSTPPAVSITSPAAGAAVSGSVAINATASDASGIQKVRFWAGATYLGYDTTAPYGTAWDTNAGLNGRYVIKAQAVDNFNNLTTTQFTVTVVNPDSTPPTVSVSAPANGAGVVGPTTIRATASDTQGLQKVQFWLDGTYLGYDDTAPYTRTWDSTTVSEGGHIIKARAIDWRNNFTDATSSIVVGNNDVTPPTITITAPNDGASVSGSTVTLSATPNDDVGIMKVRFWVDGTYLGYDTSAPYSTVWDSTTVPNGPHVIKAQSVDLKNNVSTIATINVGVNN